jgi:hypothetical protein
MEKQTDMLLDCRSAGAEIDWSRFENYAGTLEILVSDRLPDLQPMRDCPNIASIRIEGTGTSVEHPEFIGLENIKRLAIHRIKLSSWKSLVRLERLLELTIVDCNVRELSFLKPMLELSKFRLRYSRPIFAESLELNIDGLMFTGNLEEIELVLTPNITIPTIMAVQFLSNIKRLALDGCGLRGTFPASLLSGLFLEELSLEQNSLTQIPDLNLLAHLRELWLGNNKIQKANLLSLIPREPPVDIYLDQNPIHEVWVPPFCKVHLERIATDSDRKSSDGSVECTLVENDSSDSNEWTQVLKNCGNQFELRSARQTLSFIEESLDRGTQWAVFERNDSCLWEQLRICISQFLHTIYCKGALKGQCSCDAYYVACDRGVTMSQIDIESGVVRIELGLALFNPREFKIIRTEIRPT